MGILWNLKTPFNETLLWHVFLARNIGSNGKLFLLFQVCDIDAVTEQSLLPNFGVCSKQENSKPLQQLRIVIGNSCYLSQYLGDSPQEWETSASSTLPEKWHSKY